MCVAEKWTVGDAGPYKRTVSSYAYGVKWEMRNSMEAMLTAEEAFFTVILEGTDSQRLSGPDRISSQKVRFFKITIRALLPSFCFAKIHLSPGGRLGGACAYGASEEGRGKKEEVRRWRGEENEKAARIGVILLTENS